MAGAILEASQKWPHDSWLLKDEWQVGKHTQRPWRHEELSENSSSA
jgi:hypothetical protein